MSPDWSAKPVTVPYAEYGNPQTLNLYSYLGNNPITHADPDGHCGDLCTALLIRASAYVAQHPQLSNAVGKLQDSLGLKVTGSLGKNLNIGPLKVGGAVSVTAETRVNGTGSAALQVTGGLSVAGVGVQGNGIATFEKNGSFVNPLDNRSGNAKLTGSGSHGDEVNSNLAVGTDDRAGAGPAINLGLFSGGGQITAGTQQIGDVISEFVGAVVQDTKQIIQDAQTAMTCGVGACSAPEQIERPKVN